MLLLWWLLLWLGFYFLFLVYFSWVGRETSLATEIVLLKYLPTSFLVKPNIHSFSNEFAALFLKAQRPILLQPPIQAF